MAGNLFRDGKQVDFGRGTHSEPRGRPLKIGRQDPILDHTPSGNEFVDGNYHFMALRRREEENKGRED